MSLDFQVPLSGSKIKRKTDNRPLPDSTIHILEFQLVTDTKHRFILQNFVRTATGWNSVSSESLVERVLFKKAKVLGL